MSIWKLTFLNSKVKCDFYRAGNFLLATPCLAGQTPKEAKFLTEIKEEVLILLEGRQGLAAQEQENERLQKNRGGMIMDSLVVHLILASLIFSLMIWLYFTS